MAVALRPAVLLIVSASMLFFVAGGLDAASGVSDISAIESYLFGAVNLVVAVLIARGNERILALRIGLAAFFMFERPVTAAAFETKPIESIAVHLVTAVVEAVIFVSTMRLWRLGHSVSQADLAFLALPTAPAPLAAMAGAAVAVEAPSMPAPGLAVPLAPAAAKERVRHRADKVREKVAAPRAATAPRAGSGIGLLALLLAAALIGDAVASGIVPGVTVDIASPEWLVYVFALVVLVVAARAVHGGRFAVRLLLVVSLITFVERAFTPFALALTGAATLGLHAAAALFGLGLALLCAASLRATGPRRPPTAPPA